MSVSAVAKTVKDDLTGVTEYQVTCQTYGALLNNSIVTTAITYTNQTDQAIIQDLFATYLPTMSLAGVDLTTTVPTITFDNISLRQALENLIALTGANFFVDVNQVLQYHLPTVTPAPFGISETPDNVTTFAALTLPAFLSDFTNGANRVKVIGALGNGGTPITSTQNDLTSQAIYGIVSKAPIVDRNITSQAQADARANVELATYSNPLQTGTFSTYNDGLAVDQYVSIALPSINLSGSFIIQRVTATWKSSSVTQYVVEFGQYMPDLVRMLRKLTTAPPQSPATPYAVPAPMTVGAGSLASTIQAIYPVATDPVLPNASYPTGTAS